MNDTEVANVPYSGRFPTLADESGLLFACGPEAAGGYKTIADADARLSWRWLHLDGNRQATHDWIAAAAGDDAEIVNVLLPENTRPRCEIAGNRVLFVGRGVNLNPKAEPEDMVSVRAWLTKDRLVTVVLRRVKACEDVRSWVETQGAESLSPCAVLAQINRRLTQRMAPIMADLTESLDDLVEGVVAERQDIDTSDLVPLRSRAIVLHRYLAPLAIEMAELASAREDWIDGDSAAVNRDTTDRLLRIAEDLVALQAKASLARDELVSQASERLNRRVYTLTVLAALCLPLSVLTGLLGMNVGGVPLTETPNGFIITCCLLLVILVVCWFVLRRRAWL